MPRSDDYTGVAGTSRELPVQAAVLLVNLGTPEAPTAKAVRPYLAQFLGDRRVIDYPRWLWWLILHGVILRVRPARSAHAYQRIWTPAGSPLRVGSEALAARLQEKLSQACREPVRVVLAMRYGQPSVPSQIERLQREGVRRLLVLPLYPQYSATSTGSVLDAVAEAMQSLRWPPELRLINDYHDDPAHIDALARSIEQHWATRGRGERLLLSFHGIPERYVREGDPYFDQCQVTAQRLRDRLGVGAEDAVVAFQSRVGREPWLQPYTDEVLRRLPSAGVRRVQVLCPGFAVDCLETLEEIALRYRDLFVACGGEQLDYIPALNDGPAHVAMLLRLIGNGVAGWLQFSQAAADVGIADRTR